MSDSKFNEDIDRAFLGVCDILKRTLKTIDYDGGERIEILKEDMERNVTFASTTASAEIGKLMQTIYPIGNKEKKSRGVGGLPPTASERPPMSCKTQKLRVRSRCHRRKRWNSDNSRITRSKKR